MVFDGTGVWIYRKMKARDYCLFPEVHEFYETLRREKEDFYGECYSKESPF